MTGKAQPEQDKFVAMVTAKAEISLPLGQFQPPRLRRRPAAGGIHVPALFPVSGDSGRVF